MYSFNRQQHIWNLLPIRWRKSNWISVLMVFTKPLNTVYLRFNQFRLLIWHKAKFNGQTVYLEHYLNDFFALQYDVATRDADIAAKKIISIHTPEPLEAVVLYQRNELQNTLVLKQRGETPLQTGGVLYQREELQTAPSFVVYFPTTIQYNEKMIKKLINHYVFAGRKYTIQTYS